MNLMIPFGKSKFRKKYRSSKTGKWVYVYDEPVGRKSRMPSNKVKTLANQDDVKHSMNMIRAMYRRRPPGEGFQCAIASKSDLSLILKNTTFALMSAGRNPSDPEDMKLTDAQITARGKKLREDLMNSGYVITDTIGNYDGLEDSMMIMTHDANKKEMMALGAMNKQDSVIVVTNGRQDMVFTAGPNAGKSDMSGTGFEYVPDADNYYTEVKVGSETVKFSLNFGNLEKAMRLTLDLYNA